MAGYRATPMQFQFLAVSGRAAGDASIRDQPPVKSCASLRLTPKRNPVVSSLSLSIRLTLSPYIYLSLSLCSLSCILVLVCLIPSALPFCCQPIPEFPGIPVFRWTSTNSPPPSPPSFHRVNASNAWRPEFRVLKSWTGPVSSQFDELGTEGRRRRNSTRISWELENCILGICLYDTIFWDKGFKIDKIFL